MTSVTSADGTRIAVESTGTGPPLVFVVGAFCERDTTRELAGLLSDRFTVSAYDRRGRGDSGNTLPYAVEREYEDLAAVCAYAGGSPGVYGHSSGAILVARAVIEGLPVSRLALYDPPWSETSDGDGNATRSRDIEAAVADGRPGDAAAIFLAVAGMPAGALAGMRQSPDWGHFERLAPTLPYDLAQTGDLGVPVEGLAGIDVPVLLLNGSDSPPFFATVAGRAAAAIPGSAYRVVEGQGHGVEHAAIAPVLAGFFAPTGDDAAG